MKIKSKIKKPSKIKSQKKITKSKRKISKIGKSKLRNPKIDLNDYEYKGRWNSADLVWACKKCGYSANKSKETPEHIRHHPDCPIKTKQDTIKNPKDHKLTQEKILEFANTPGANSEFVSRYLNEVISDKTPSLVAYGEIADLYYEGRVCDHTYKAIRDGLDIYFNESRGFAKRNPSRKNPIVSHNKQAFVPANVKNWMRKNVGNFEELDEYGHPIYPIRINFTRLLDGSLRYFKQPGSHEYGNYPEWLSKLAFDVKVEYERKHRNDRPPVDDFDDF